LDLLSRKNENGEKKGRRDSYIWIWKAWREKLRKNLERNAETVRV
jgi:hypothetical protein